MLIERSSATLDCGLCDILASPYQAEGGEALIASSLYTGKDSCDDDDDSLSTIEIIGYVSLGPYYKLFGHH